MELGSSQEFLNGARIMERYKTATAKAFVTSVFLAVLMPAALILAGPLPPVNNEQDLTEQDLAREVVIYNRNSTAPCFADYVPSDEEVRAPFALSMAGNEYESMQVGLYVPSGSEAVRNIRLQVHCDIPSTVGYIYYQPEDELSWTGNLDEDHGQPWQGKRSVLPMFVIPKIRITAVEPGRSSAFWVTFKTNERVSPGNYRGSMKIHAGGKLLESVPFVIKVYPFLLPRPTITFGLYYTPYRTDPTFQGRAFQRRYLADMSAHGMNSMTVAVDYKALSTAGYDLSSSTPVNNWGWTSTSSRQFCDNYFGSRDYEPDGGYNVIKFADAQIKMGRRAGLIQLDQPLMTWPSACETDNKANTVSALERFSAERGWPDFVLYMFDEPGPPIFPRVIEHNSQWKREGAKTICAMSILAAFGVGHVHDVWIVHAGYITPELQQEAQRLGAKVWTYNFSLRTTNTEAGRYYAGLYSWSLGLAGNFTYNYMWLPTTGPGIRKQAYFDDKWKLSKPAGLGHVIPSPAGPVPGVGFEGRREGVDDCRYLQLLEARVKGAAESNSTAIAAKRWLDCLRKDGFWPGFLPTSQYSADWMVPHPGLSSSDYDAIRAKAAAFIMQLPPAEGEINGEPAKAPRIESSLLESWAFEGSSIEDCLEALRTGTIKQKRQAASALALRNPSEAQPALLLLIGLLDVPEVRMVALRALANLGPEASPAIPTLSALLDSDDAFIRVGATYVLTRIGPEAAKTLIKCKNDPNHTIANLASEVLDSWK